jgi:hypothetical protein
MIYKSTSLGWYLEKPSDNPYGLTAVFTYDYYKENTDGSLSLVTGNREFPGNTLDQLANIYCTIDGTGEVPVLTINHYWPSWRIYCNYDTPVKIIVKSDIYNNGTMPSTMPTDFVKTCESSSLMSFESWSSKSTLLIQHAQELSGTDGVLNTIYVSPKKGITFLTQGNVGILNNTELATSCPSGWFGATTLYPISTASYYDTSTESYESSDLISQVKIWDPTKKASVRIDVESESSEVSVVRTLTISGSGTEDEGDLIYEIIVKAYQSTIYGKMTLYADIYNSVNDISDRRLTLLSSKSEEAHAYLSVDGVGTTNNPRKLLLEDSSFNVKEGSIFTQDYDSDQEDYSIYTTDGDVSTKTGDVYSNTGDLYSETGDIDCKAGSLIIGKNLVSNSFSYPLSSSTDENYIPYASLKQSIYVTASTAAGASNILSFVSPFSTALELDEALPIGSLMTIYNVGTLDITIETKPDTNIIILRPSMSIIIRRVGNVIIFSKYVATFTVLWQEIKDSAVETEKIKDEAVTLAKIEKGLLSETVTYNVNRVISPTGGTSEKESRWLTINNSYMQEIYSLFGTDKRWKVCIKGVLTGSAATLNVANFNVYASDTLISTSSRLSTNTSELFDKTSVNEYGNWKYIKTVSDNGVLSGIEISSTFLDTEDEKEDTTAEEYWYKKTAGFTSLINTKYIYVYMGCTSTCTSPITINATITFERVS